MAMKASRLPPIWAMVAGRGGGGERKSRGNQDHPGDHCGHPGEELNQGSPIAHFSHFSGSGTGAQACISVPERPETALGKTGRFAFISPMPESPSRTVLITGASSGIGEATARGLSCGVLDGPRGGAPDRENGRTRGAGARIHALDLNVEDSIRDLAREVLDDRGGVGCSSTMRASVSMARSKRCRWMRHGGSLR